MQPEIKFMSRCDGLILGDKFQRAVWNGRTGRLHTCRAKQQSDTKPQSPGKLYTWVTAPHFSFDAGGVSPVSFSLRKCRNVAAERAQPCGTWRGETVEGARAPLWLVLADGLSTSRGIRDCWC